MYTKKLCSFLLLSFILLLTGCKGEKGDIFFSNDNIGITIDNRGYIVSIKAKGKEYLHSSTPSPLVRLYDGENYILPNSFKVNENGKIEIIFEDGTTGQIEEENLPGYFKFTIKAISKPHEGIKWGPYRTIISKWIGEKTNTVHDDNIALAVLTDQENTDYRSFANPTAFGSEIGLEGEKTNSVIIMACNNDLACQLLAKRYPAFLKADSVVVLFPEPADTTYMPVLPLNDTSRIMDGIKFCKRNLLPTTLGIYEIPDSAKIEEIERISTKSVAFNAGYAVRFDNEFESNDFSKPILEAISQWEEARQHGTFNEELLFDFQYSEKNFHIEKCANDGWYISEIHLERGNKTDYGYRFQNPYIKQPVKFYGHIVENTDSIRILFGKGQEIKIDTPLKAGDRFYCNGLNLYLCNHNWRRYKAIDTKYILWESGINEIKIYPIAVTRNVEIEMKSIGVPCLVKRRDD